MFSNSRLVVSQVESELVARDERMQGYLTRIRHLQRKFESFDLQHIPRGGNTYSDSLATLATSSTENLPCVILIEDLGKPLEQKKEYDLCSPCQNRAQLDGSHHSIP